MEIRPLHPVLGAEVLGLDLTHDVPDDVLFLVRYAFNRNSVLVFRDQDRLPPERHIAFSRRFGELEVHVLREFLHPEHQEILLVSNARRNGRPIGLAEPCRHWHSDLSYKANPSLASLVHARNLPSRCGDTLFASMTAAYERLPDRLRGCIDTLRAEHDYAARPLRPRIRRGKRPVPPDERPAAVPPVVHPVVRVHDETGRRALFVNQCFTTRIVGVPEREGGEILARLFAAAVEPGIIYRHRWREGDMVMWDNRAVIHRAIECAPSLPRTMHRTTVRGDAPIGIAR